MEKIPPLVCCPACFKEIDIHSEHNCTPSLKSRDKAAAAVGVNPRYVSDAKAIKEASPEIAEKVKV